MTTANKFNELPENNHQNGFSINKRISAPEGRDYNRKTNGLRGARMALERRKNGCKTDCKQKRLHFRTAVVS